MTLIPGHSALSTGQRLLLVALAALFCVGVPAASAQAHGFSSVVYADVHTGAQPGHVHVGLQLEYDLLVVSAADAERTDRLFRDGTAAFTDGTDADRAQALVAHLNSVQAYLADHFTITSSGQPCPATPAADVAMTVREGVPYAVIELDAACDQPGDEHLITSTLFPDAEGYVTGTTTILTYDLDLHAGSAALNSQQTSFSTEQTFVQRFTEFFRLGAEHLLGGIDHILFLLALIVGSRRLREVVFAATAFTLAHSVTFILAATHTVSLPSSFVEPTIAASIAIVGGWHLWRLRSAGVRATELTGEGFWGLDRPGWVRLGVVFTFGLVHGMGFASALGIDQPWSWTLLWSLLVFNLGIEAVQIGIIALAFPLLTLLRRHSPSVGAWVTGAIAAFVAVAGMVWFVQRVLGLG